MARMKRGGPRYQRGESKDRILLIALNYPDGIVESILSDNIRHSLRIGSESENKVIKDHLSDLGPGRIVKGKWKDGEHYLIKIPSKFDTVTSKKKILGLFEKDLNAISLPDESIWLPDEDPDVFIRLADRFLNSSFDNAFAFVNTKYTRRLIETEAVIKIFKERTHIVFSGEEKEKIKIIISLSPLALRTFIFSKITGDTASLSRYAQMVETVSEQRFRESLSKSLSNDITDELPKYSNIIASNKIIDISAPFLDHLRSKDTTALIIQLLSACYMVDIAVNPKFFKPEERK